MDNQKQSVAQVVKEANNVLVTVSANPSVDQLAACIGLTLALNKLGKHATAVFSGVIPSTIEFLQPEKTLEKNTDSLRDFIIALDKAKADKLRYKVEDKVVKIFITPYKTSIGEHDLEFSQGDFNVDVVIAIGVHVQTDLDQAITAHGRILHDANIITINSKPGGELGGINWLQDGVSSLSELASQLVITIDKSLIDAQIATAFLTGIVAETERFSNSLTSPQTMSIAAELMSAGANQQLVATKLQAPTPAAAPAPVPIPKQESHEVPKSNDGTLEITHDKKDADEAVPEADEHPAVYDPEYKDGDAAPETSVPEQEPAAAPEPPVEPTPTKAPEEPKPEPAPEPVAEPTKAPEEPPAEISTNDDSDEHTPEERALLSKPKSAKSVHKNSRPYLGNPSAHDDAALIGMPNVAPEPTAIMPDMLTAPKDPLSLPDLDMPLLERQPLTHPAFDTPEEKKITDASKAEEPTAEQVKAVDPQPEKAEEPEPAKAPAFEPVKPDQHGGDTLSDIEKEVNSPHISGLSDYETLDSDPVTKGQTPAASGLTLPEAGQSTETVLPDLPGGPPAHPVPAAPATPEPKAEEPAVILPDTPAKPESTADSNSQSVTGARDAVEQAINAMSIKTDQPQEPIQALNAQPLNMQPLNEANDENPIKGSTGIIIVPPEGDADNDADDADAPPPIPPPLMPSMPSPGK